MPLPRRLRLGRADLLVPPQVARAVGVLAAEPVVAVEALGELDLPVEKDGLVLLPDLGPLLVFVPERTVVNPGTVRHLRLHDVVHVHLHLMLLGILHDLLDHSMLHLHGCTVNMILVLPATSNLAYSYIEQNRLNSYEKTRSADIWRSGSRNRRKNSPQILHIWGGEILTDRIDCGFQRPQIVRLNAHE